MDAIAPPDGEPDTEDEDTLSGLEARAGGRDDGR